ncbi:FG-GAP repeat domain-containing protein [candidate division CSSED10-310 bacterium]|uniref:FG-GAP repeat domain-containing protein n=1 Tax=candidate division CSSED10-310 bacterium TaxID=2855610 RepID=A0ABV6Z1L7_UNCC1
MSNNTPIGITLFSLIIFYACLTDFDLVQGFWGPNTVWLNNGNGTFTNSGQALGTAESAGIDLGDLNGDGALDVFVTNANTSNQVWFNDGAGNFNNSGQGLGDSDYWRVALGDFDQDSDLDALVVRNGFYTYDNLYNQVWINDNQGNFTSNDQFKGYNESWGLALGDLDGDNDLDAFIANDRANKVWPNRRQ